MNVYEESGPESRMEMSLIEKTEDVYQTLHQPPVVKNPHPEHGSVRGSRFKMMLMVFNTLIITLLITVLLIAVLILIGLRSEPAAEIQQNAAVDEPQLSDEDRELWRLREGDYYLFWEAEGTCTDAQNFCKERNCIIGYVTTENQNWTLSHSKGKKMWINTRFVPSKDLDESLRHCPMTGGDSEKAQGWVCTDRNVLHLLDTLFEHHENDTITEDHETVTDAPHTT